MKKCLACAAVMMMLLLLSGCMLAKQDETYSHGDVCEGLRRRMVFASSAPNMTGTALHESYKKLHTEYLENNCEEETEE